MNKFNVGEKVWFYSNPDNLNSPLDGIVFCGEITSVNVVTEKKTHFDKVDESCRVQYSVEVVWDDFSPKEEEMFLTEKEAKDYAKTVITTRIGKINERLNLFIKLRENLDE